MTERCVFCGETPATIMRSTVRDCVGPHHIHRWKEKTMHYRNGREAKNGDRVIQLSYEGGKVLGVGILHDAVPGNDHCNGNVAPVTGGTGACLADCIHADDLAALLAEKGLDKRAPGK